jgi:acyl-CoA synthetase (AMP-forming)/AMP-acid ligase II
MLKQLENVFPNARIVQTYACTEAASSMTFLEIKPTTRMSVSLPDAGPTGDCVGVPPAHVELGLFCLTESHERIQIRTAFQVGIFGTRGPHVMNGYWYRDQQIMSQPKNDWMLTHDLGFMDESGQFFFCGRSKDVIRSGGETVSASEVERILLQHKSIAETAVFALPEERFGETVCAAVVPSQDCELPLTLARVRQHCTRQGLASYKCPRRLYLLKELPRNSSGKVLKFRLVERYSELLKLQNKL